MFFAIVLACSKDEPVPITGTIAGNVTEENSTNAIAGASVSLAGEVNQATSTGTSGSFSFANIVAGSYQVTVSKSGYVTQTKNITLQAEKTASANFSLLKNIPNVNPNQLELTTEDNSKTIELENTRSAVMNFTTQTSKDWLTVSPSTGSINQGNKLIITVTADLENVPYNTYTETLIINVGEASVSIPITVVHTEPPYITITSPKKDEVYKMGNIMSIRWDSNLEGKVSIDLIRESEVKAEISTETENDNGGNFDWEIPALEEEYYTLRITSKENENISNETEPFKIDKGPTVPVVITKDSKEVLTDKISVLGELSSLGVTFEKVNQYGHIFSSSDENPKIDSNKTNLGETSQIGEFTSNLIDLVPGTAYYVRAYAVNEKGVGYGEVKTITTTVGVPSVETLESTDIEKNEATVKGNIKNDGGSSITERGIVWGIESPVNIDSNVIKDGESKTGEYSLKIDNLSSGTLYYYRAYAKNSNGIAYGEQKSFTTLPDIPAVETTSVSENGPDKINGSGNISSNGGAEILEYGFVYSKSNQTPTIDDSKKSTENDHSGEYSMSIDELTPNTTYYIRAFARNEQGVGYGDMKSAKTEEGQYFTVKNPSENEGINVDSKYSIKWETNYENQRLILEHFQDGIKVKELNNNINSGSLSYNWDIEKSVEYNTKNVLIFKNYSSLNEIGKSKEFTIKKYLNLTSPIAGQSTYSSELVINWEINYSTDIKLELYSGSNLIKTLVDNYDGSKKEYKLEYNHTELNSGTNYRVKIIDLNDEEMYVLSDYFEIKEIEVPIIKTSTPGTYDPVNQNIEVGGEEIYDRGNSIIKKGVIWSKEKENLDINNNLGASNEGGNNNDFTYVIDGLNTINEKFYVRAYAENSAGIGYGEAIEFKTDKFVDHEGNIYNIYSLSNGQVWSSNLRMTTYSDGTKIKKAETLEELRYMDIGAYYDPRDEFSDYDIEKYGLAYNAIVLKGRHDKDESTAKKTILPDGWKFPSNYDFGTLMNSYSGDELTATDAKYSEAASAATGFVPNNSSEFFGYGVSGGASTTTGSDLVLSVIFGLPEYIGLSYENGTLDECNYTTFIVNMGESNFTKMWQTWGYYPDLNGSYSPYGGYNPDNCSGNGTQPSFYSIRLIKDD